MTSKDKETEYRIVSGSGRPPLSGSQLDEVRRREMEKFHNNQLFIIKYLYEKRIDDEYRADDNELAKYLQIEPSAVWKHIRHLEEDDSGNGPITVHRFNIHGEFIIKYSISKQGITTWENYIVENTPHILSDVKELQQAGNELAKEIDLKILEKEISIKKWDALNKALAIPQIIDKWASELFG